MATAVSAEPLPPTADVSVRVRGQTLILACFFLSGVSGLIYEIIWTRLTALTMGATVYSLTTVLVAFMGGLGLGAWIIGGLLRRHAEWSRLRLYGAFEICIGLWCLFLPALMRAAKPLFALAYNRLYGNDPGALFAYSLAQFGIIAPMLLVPTTLMGATLPVLADHVARHPARVGRSVGLVYGINTFGAVLGAAATGYALIPLIGFHATNILAVTGNVAAGSVALWLAGRTPSPPTPLPQGEREAAETDDGQLATGGEHFPLAIVFLIFGLSGLASMTYQIGWTRVIALIIDSTTYSFTAIVTCFILGLALGAWLLSPMIDREPRPLLLLGLIEAFIGLTAMVTIPILGLLSAWVFFLMIRFHGNWFLMQGIVFALVLAMLILPTMLMGATFPLVARICSRRRGDVGPVVGKAYAINAIGTIAGSFIAGFILIPHPHVGMQGTLIAATALSVLLGIIAVLASPRLRPSGRALGAFGLGGLWIGGFLLCVPRHADGTRGWNKDIITSSPFFFYERFFMGSLALDLDFTGYLKTLGQIVDYREDPYTTVVIRTGTAERPNTYMIFTGGRPEASDKDVQQNILMHLGMMLHPHPRRVLTIGLGSGSTARTATYHPDLEHLDVVEISPAVVELSAKYFPDVHADLERAGAHIIVADGRNHLALTDQVYDVIVSQPSHPHLTGVANLFTRDFFQLCRDRLAPGGICVIWNFSWRIAPEMFKAYVRSFHDVFPASFLVISQGSYTFLVGFNSDRPEIDYRALRRHLEECTDPVLASDMSVADSQMRLIWYEPRHILDLLTLGPRGVERYVGKGPVNTDDNALLEFALPRTYDVDDSADIKRDVNFIRDRLSPPPGQPYDPSRCESVWEYVTNAPPEVLPAQMRMASPEETSGASAS
jgi:spermidine synthase